MALSYSHKKITYIFYNASGFNSKGDNTITITDVKSTLRVDSIGNLYGNRATLNLIGLSTELLALLSYKSVWNRQINAIMPGQIIALKIMVDNDLIFKGYITTSYTNMNTLPEPILCLSAYASSDAALDNYPAFSAKGNILLPDAVKAILAPYNYSYNITPDVSKINLVNPHYIGSSWQKILEICKNYNLAVYQHNDIVNIWHATSTRDNIKPFVSANTGLVGYPVFITNGIQFQTTYSPLLAAGRIVTLQTTLPYASGEYLLNSVEHVLSSWIDGGPWYTLCQAAIFNDRTST